MLFSPGSRAGNSSNRRRSVVAWRVHLLITVVVETSLPKAQPISGVVVDSSGSPLQSDGKGDSNAAEPVTRSTATVVGEDMFHLEHEVSPDVPDIFPRETKPQEIWQEVEVSGTHLVRQPAARLLRSKGGHKMPSDTPSKQNQFWMISSGRMLEATYGFVAVAIFGWICLMYPQIPRDADSSRRTSSPPPPPCTLPPSWGPEMEPRYSFSSWVRDVRTWEENESRICAQRRAHKVFAQLTTSAKELVQDIPVQQLTQAHIAQGRKLDPVSRLLTVVAERHRRINHGDRPSYTDLILEFTWGNARTYDEVLYKFDTLVMHARAEENFSMPRAGLANLLMKACGISNTERLLIQGHFGRKHPETAKEFEEFLEVMRPLARKPQTRTDATAIQNAGIGGATSSKGAGKISRRTQWSTDSPVRNSDMSRSLSSQGLNIQADEFHPGTDTTGAVPQSGVVNRMDIHPGTDTTGAVPQSGVVNVPLFRNQARMVQRTDGSFHIIRPRSPETRSEWSGPGSPKVVLPKPYLTGFTVPRPKPKPPDPPPIAGSSAASSSYEIQAIYEDVDWSEARVAPNPSRTSKSVTFSPDIVECRDSLDDLSSSSSSSSAVATFVPIPGTATNAVDEAEMLKLTPRSGMDRPTMTDGEVEYFMINIEDGIVSRKLAWDKCKGCSGRRHQRDPRHSRVYGECRYPFVDAFAPPCRTYSFPRADRGYRSQDTDIPEDPRVLGTWKRCPGCVNRFPATHSLHTFLVGECLSACIPDAEVEAPMINEDLEGGARNEACLETSQADNQLLEHPVWQMCQGCDEELPLHHPIHSRVIGECRFPFAESEQTVPSAASSSKVSTLTTEAHDSHIDLRDEITEESLSVDQIRRIQAASSQAAENIELTPISIHPGEDRPEPESDASYTKCTICTEKFRDRELMQMLGCGHVYHVTCWQSALLRRDARVVRITSRATTSSQDIYETMTDNDDVEAVCPSCGEQGHATALFTCNLSKPTDAVQVTRSPAFRRKRENSSRGSASIAACDSEVAVEEDERSSFPISPCTDDTMEPLAPEYQPFRHEEESQRMTDQEYIMIDTGSWTNVTGALAAGRLSATARRAGHKVNTKHFEYSLKLTGVGEGRQVCHKELKIPICLKSMNDQQAGLHWYEAPVMHANNPADKAATCPAILGLKSLESLNAIIETSAAGPTLILPSDDGYVLTCHRATKYKLVKMSTGQLALPTHAFREISRLNSSGAFPKQSPAGYEPGRAVHTAVNSIVSTGRPPAPLRAPIWFPAKTVDRCTRSDDFSGEPSRFPYAGTEAMSQAMAALRSRTDSENAEGHNMDSPSSSGRTLAEVEVIAARAIVTAQAWLKRPRRD